MRARDLHPQLHGTFRGAVSLPLHHPVVRFALQIGVRVLPPPRVAVGLTRKVVRLSGSPRRLRVFVPDRGSGGALLWLHGGGMSVGSAAQDDRLCQHVAAALDAVVVSVEYRMLPRHPYPAPLDDAEAAWDWLFEHAPGLGVDPARIAVGGQSAGGCLAAALAARLHDRGTAPAPAAQWLFCPMLDDRTAADRDLDRTRHLVWSNRSNRGVWSAYLGVEPGSAGVQADASPARREDLAGLPPAWIGAGTADLFHDEAEDYVRRLAAAGVDAVFDALDGAPHAVESFAWHTPITQAYLDRATTWLGERIAS